MLASTRRQRRSVLIIATEGNCFSNPSLKCIIDLLLEEGSRIDLRYPTSPALTPTLSGVRLLPFGPLVRNFKTVVFNRLCSWRMAILSVVVEKLFLYQKYDLVIGVDRQGLIEASILNLLSGTPFVFVSFEIMFESETSLRYKAIERRASRTASLWLIQDEVRAEQLQIENGLQPANRFLLPLASAGPGALSASRLRDRLLIPKEKNVAILIGSVANWSMAGRILRSVAGWPEDWALIVHQRYGRTREDLGPDLAAVESLVRRRIFISDAASAMVDDLGSVLAGVSAGLAFYEPDFKSFHTGKNLEYLGMAAGKISTYLRYGIPVVLNEIGLYAEEARQYQFGIVVESPEMIRDCLDLSLDDRYRAGARDYFSRKLDFNNYREAVSTRLHALMGVPQKAANA